MARKRMISPEFWRDEKVAELTTTERLLWIGLWTTSDDEGVGRANYKLIKADLFPYDDMNEGEVERGMAKIEALGMIQIYTVNGYDYYYIPNFLKHQTISRPTKSNLPKPPQPGQKQVKKAAKKEQETEENHPENSIKVDTNTGEIIDENEDEFIDFRTDVEKPNIDSRSTHGVLTECSLNAHGALHADSIPIELNISKDKLSKDNILCSDEKIEKAESDIDTPQKQQQDNNNDAGQEHESVFVSTTSRNILTKAQETAFDAFWDLYPKKIGKDAAKRAWQKRKPDKQLQDEIIEGVKRAIEKDRRFKAGYIPNPATWLNAGEWQNEYSDSETTTAPSQQKSGSYKRKPRASGEMDEHDRRSIEAMISKRSASP
jgi:hypothetical protein